MEEPIRLINGSYKSLPLPFNQSGIVLGVEGKKETQLASYKSLGDSFNLPPPNHTFFPKPQVKIPLPGKK